VINQILEDLLAAAPGAKATIFLDTDGESIAQAGDTTIDIKLLGAWKEIHLQRQARDGRCGCCIVLA